MVLSPITHSDGEGNCRTKDDEAGENERGKGRWHRANGVGRGRREAEGMIKVTERQGHVGVYGAGRSSCPGR